MTKLCVSTLTALAFVCLLSPLSAQQGDAAPRQATASAGQERIWEGYLWRDREGRVRMGQSVIAMGVKLHGACIVGGRLGRSLESHVSGVNDSWFFWNYEWIGKADGEGLPDTALDRVPRVRVRLRGVVVVERGGQSGAAGRMVFPAPDRTMVSGRVESVEFLSEAWLRAWQDLVKLDFNPYWRWKNGKAIEADAERCKTLMEKAVPALLKMRGLSRVSDDERKRARAIEPETTAVNHLRRRMEGYAHRWLLRMQETHGIEVAGIDELGSLAPNGTELQRWFCAAADKAAFLAKIRERYAGDLAQLKLPYYVSPEPRSLSWTTVRVNLVEKEWSDDDFRRHQTLTRKTLEEHR